jgi:hypothetical protein
VAGKLWVVVDCSTANHCRCQSKSPEVRARRVVQTAERPRPMRKYLPALPHLGPLSAPRSIRNARTWERTLPCSFGSTSTGKLRKACAHVQHSRMAQWGMFTIPHVRSATRCENSGQEISMSATRSVAAALICTVRAATHRVVTAASWMASTTSARSHLQQ